MLDSTRLRNPQLFDKIVTPEEAAALITDGMNVGVSGFTPSGYPKKTTIALAKAIKEGKRCRINIWSGASVGPEIEEELAAVGAIKGRMPYYAASNKSMKKGINEGKIEYVDQHLSHFGQQVDYGFFGNVDVAIIEATAITAEGNIILGPGVGNAPIFVKHAKKIIIEVNTSIPLNLEGMHDIYIPAIPPNRTEIPIYHAGDRIGKPYVECGIDRIDCIVESDILDHVRDLTAPDAASIKIAENLVEFLEYEQKMGCLPEKMLPLQSSVGSIANAVLLGLAKSRFENLEMYSEILQDSVFRLIKLEDDTQREISDCVNGYTGTLRVSLSPSMSISFIQTYLSKFSKEYPQINYELYEVSILEQINQMLTGKTEIGVANAPLTQESRFDTIYTKQERLVAVMHKDNPWLPADDKALLLAHMEDMPICLSRGCSTLFLNVCSDSMIFPQILSINSTKLSTIAWAKENAGIAVVPASPGEIFDNDLICKIIRDDRLFLNKTLSIVKGRPLSNVAQLFLNYFSQHS